MANKITVTLDLLKIDKSRIVDRVYKNKEGVEVKVKDYQIEVIELNNPKLIKEADTWMLKETHFVTDAPTKEERYAKAKMRTVGRGTSLSNKANTTAEETRAKITAQVNNDYNEVEKTSVGYNGEQFTVDDVAF